MNEKAQPMDDVAEQAIHDRSVIDHVVHTFSSGAEDGSPKEPGREQSAQIYHQIRRTWPDPWEMRPAAVIYGR
ncbi:MAG TPA: hypothetical protein VN832_04430 [Stellaceae bacterium]|nr:hypothetical protein [Stellaceae bacterium]